MLYSSFSFALVVEGQLLWLHQRLLSRSAVKTIHEFRTTTWLNRRVQEENNIFNYVPAVI